MVSVVVRVAFVSLLHAFLIVFPIFSRRRHHPRKGKDEDEESSPAACLSCALALQNEQCLWRGLCVKVSQLGRECGLLAYVVVPSDASRPVMRDDGRCW